MMAVNTSPGRCLLLDGKPFLYFGGTSYLGLHMHPAFQEMLVENLRIWGTAWGSSRNSNVRLSAYEAGEQYLANLTGMEAALTVSSGMLAGKLVVDTLGASTDRFYYLPGHHPAIHAQDQQPFYIDGRINPSLLDDKPERVTLLTDGVASNQVQPLNLQDIARLPAHKAVTLVVDESHSLGILGENGGGITGSLLLPNVARKIMVASLGKALGLTGGVIAGDAGFIEAVQQTDCFISGAGMNPAFAKTLADAKELISAQHIQLKDNLQYLHRKLNPGVPVLFHVDYPLLYPQHEELYDHLYRHQVLITHFRYPTSDHGLNRIVICAHHTREDLDRLAEVLNGLSIPVIFDPIPKETF